MEKMDRFRYGKIQTDERFACGAGGRRQLISFLQNTAIMLFEANSSK